MKENETEGKERKIYLIRLSKWITEQRIEKMVKEQTLLSAIKDGNFWRDMTYRSVSYQAPHIYKTYIASNDYFLYPVFIDFMKIP